MNDTSAAMKMKTALMSQNVCAFLLLFGFTRFSIVMCAVFPISHLVAVFCAFATHKFINKQRQYILLLVSPLIFPILVEMYFSFNPMRSECLSCCELI